MGVLEQVLAAVDNAKRVAGTATTWQAVSPISIVYGMLRVSLA